MATSFLPQPGDGAWLLQPGSRRGGGGQKVLRSFLREDPVGYEQDQTLQQHNTATNRLASFLPPTTYLPTSWAQRFDEPRTIADEKLLSTNGQDQDQDQGARTLSPPPFSLQPRPTASFSDTPTPVPQYTTEDQHTADPMASTAATKALPPHLRTRPASAASTQHNTKSKSGPESRAGSDTIREKLASNFGVKVSDPRPASPLVPYPASEDEWGTLSKAAAESTKASEQDGVRINGTAEPIQEQPPPARKRVPSPVNRGRGRGGKSAPRDARWPKPSETKADPNRWVTNWGSEKSFSSTIDSAQADSGFGEGKKKRAPANGGFKLTDWAGSWAPAPIDWDARPAFRDPNKLSDIDRWMERIDEEMCGVTRAIPIEKITAVGDEEKIPGAPCDVLADNITTVVGDEIVPRYWVPITFPRNVETKTSMAPQTFWKEVVIKSDAPKPMHDDDLKEARPWWEFMKALDSVFLKPYNHPIIKGIDPDENMNERLARENDQGADQHAQNRKRTELAKRDAQRERRKKAQEKARKFSESAPIVNRERVKPGLNIYLRSARPADMVQIRDIYNHYIDFTCCTPETERRTTGDMNHRYNDILANRLPFLVACVRGGKVPNRRKKRNPEDDLVLPDTVVGFAFADDYNDMTGMYRFTAEVEVYTDKQHYMKGVAKCLLDKLTGLLDPDYLERGGYDVQGEELEGVGPSRVIKNIIVNVPFEKPERLEWVSRWLRTSLDFEQKGLMEDIGHKLSKSVSLAIFKRTTGATVDPANPPICTGYPL